jgi:hypothetical protein
MNERRTDEQVDRKTYYDVGHGLQVIDIIESRGLSFHLGNVLKYIMRSPLSGERLVDLQKARWYLDRAIGRAEPGPTTERTECVLRDVAVERQHQEHLKLAGKFRFTCADRGLSDPERLAILAEEFGEVARDVVERGEGLRRELIQIAAVCVAWIERLDAGEVAP